MFLISYQFDENVSLFQSNTMNAPAIILRHLIHRIFIDGIIQDDVFLAAPHVHNGDDLGAVGLRGGSELSTSQAGSSHLPAEVEFLVILCTYI